MRAKGNKSARNGDLPTLILFKVVNKGLGEVRAVRPRRIWVDAHLSESLNLAYPDIAYVLQWNG